jgi:hypothetical protein
MTKALARRASWIAMILALSLVVAACGGDSGSSDTTEGGGTDTTQGDMTTTTVVTETGSPMISICLSRSRRPTATTTKSASRSLTRQATVERRLRCWLPMAT